MVTRQELIAAKRAHILHQIERLEARTAGTVTIGGRAVIGPLEEIAFQRRRLAELSWAMGATDDEIRARIISHEKALSAQALACKYGDVSGLSSEEVEAVSMIELLEIAIGTHPGVR